MSDYDIRPNPKIWAGSPKECRMLFARIKRLLLVIGECTEIENYVRKNSVYAKTQYIVYTEFFPT